jgi:hypothetical protein
MDITELLDGSDPVVYWSEYHCPSCDAYLHMYAAVCFGCGYERGSAFEANLVRCQTLWSTPVDRLLVDAGVASTLSQFLGTSQPADDLAGRPGSGLAVAAAYRQIWHLDAPPAWSIPTSRVEYLGGMESAPHDEHAELVWQGGRITLIGDRSGHICSIDPARVLSISAHATLDEILAGATLGFIAGGAVFLRSMPPTQGGLIKIVFADDEGVWRMIAIGNRTGLTDKRYTFDAYRAWVAVMGDLCRHYAVIEQMVAKPYAYAADLAIDVERAADGMETASGARTESKVCPDCAETIQLAARICRYCGHAFPRGEDASTGTVRASGSMRAEARRQAASMDGNAEVGTGTWVRTFAAIRQVLFQDQRLQRLPGGADAALAVLGDWAATTLPQLRQQSATVRSLPIDPLFPDTFADLKELLLRGLESCMEAARLFTRRELHEGLEAYLAGVDTYVAASDLWRRHVLGPPALAADDRP